jgi:hypothetical protein
MSISSASTPFVDSHLSAFLEVLHCGYTRSFAMAASFALALGSLLGERAFCTVTRRAIWKEEVQGCGIDNRVVERLSRI